ncbi:MAG TPA: PQQ-binding-like beta-propeller repeat protein [Gemmatimonadaceae bacterium]|jgi:outer membrane protein assembly factor BamB|nr:PQQ-binding-like beta-propeller repeat protein [Gemmatimonadaceae bacterium]
MFRGDPAHSGRYAGGGSAIIGLQWRVPTDGDIVATPAVANGLVYIGSGNGKMYAIDRSSGATRWIFDAKSPIQSSAAVAGGAVYFASRDGIVHAIDASTGKSRWRVQTGRDLPLPWGHESGDLYVSSPAIVPGKVIIGSGDGFVYAVSPSSGGVLWKAKTGGRVRGTPAVADGIVYAGSFDGRLYALDLSTGAERWRFDTQGVTLKSQDYGFDRRSIQSSPAVAGGTVFVGARDGFLYAVDARTGKLRWTYDHKVSWINSSPAVVGDVVYAGSSDAQFLQAVDAASGKELWRAKCDNTVWGSPVVAGDVIYWGDGSGVVHASNRTNGAELASFRTGAQVHGSPVVDGNLLFIGSGDGNVYALRLGDPAAAVKRAVFFDSTYLRIAQVPNAAALSRYMADRGYALLRANEVARFLEQRIQDRAPSVVVFAIDAVPDDALEPSPERSLMRRYLDAGGKIVWVGLPPAIWPVEPLKGERHGLNEIDWEAPNRLLGVSFADAIFDQRSARATDAGVRWGLPLRWRTGWSVAPATVSEVLATDDLGLAGAWLKSYGGAPGTGFVRVPPDIPFSVYLASEYRPVK